MHWDASLTTGHEVASNGHLLRQRLRHEGLDWHAAWATGPLLPADKWSRWTVHVQKSIGNQARLYVGVCETYLMMHAYGLNIKAPSRESVVKLLKDMDDDDSGEIDYEEFKELLQELMLAQSSRICTQLGLTVLSPVSAGYVVDGIKYAWIALALPSLPFLPDSLTEGSMGETVVTGMLMCSVNPMLALVTSLNEKRTALARQQKALNKKMKAQ